MGRLTAFVPVLCLAAGAAFAEAPDQAVRPLPRPAAAAAPVAAPVATPVAAPVADAPAEAIAPAPAAQAKLRPRPRPAPPAVAEIAAAAAAAPMQFVAALPRSLRPLPRPDDLGAEPAPRRGLFKAALAPRVKPGKEAAVSRKGSVCGDPAIKGETLAPIKARIKGCGVAEPVQVTSIDGIRLSQPAIVDCDTALALRRWIDEGLRPAYGRAKVVELKVAAHYICRPRNNVKGAKISEHGRGKAIDIAGFTLSNGKQVSVLRDFDRTMRKAYKAACGIFGTTLGPGSDGYHEDHMHFDTASYRKGSYCR